MSDVVEQVDVAEPEAEGTAEKQDKTNAKTFTQDEVNRLIGRERESLRKRYEADLEAKDAQLNQFDSIVRGSVEERLKELPESLQKVISKLPLMEQYEALQAEDLQVSKKTIPSTQKQQEKPKPTEEAKTEAFSRFRK